ncbi:MAG: hypothetical protein H6828_15925 [Planctomycetes bacterium]|nr:hypothetical protein [Planctomycetota bacterium]
MSANDGEIVGKDERRDAERAVVKDHRWAIDRLLGLLRDEHQAAARERNRAVALLLGVPALYGIVAVVRPTSPEPGSALPALRVVTLVAVIVAVVQWMDVARRADPPAVPLDDLGYDPAGRAPRERLLALRRGLEGRVQQARNASGRRDAVVRRAWLATSFALLGLALLLTLAALG